MTEADDRRAEERAAAEGQAVIELARAQASSQPPLRVAATVVNRSRSGCCLAFEKLQMESLHLLDCLEDPDEFRIEVTLPAAKRSEARSARVTWINRVFDGPGPVFRVGFELGKPVR